MLFAQLLMPSAWTGASTTLDTASESAFLYQNSTIVLQTCSGVGRAVNLPWIFLVLSVITPTWNLSLTCMISPTTTFPSARNNVTKIKCACSTSCKGREISLYLLVTCRYCS